MYKLLNYIFGWDYVHWTHYGNEGTSRVISLKDGTVIFWRHNMCLSILDDPKQVVWLTCKSIKYIKEKVNG